MVGWPICACARTGEVPNERPCGEEVGEVVRRAGGAGLAVGVGGVVWSVGDNVGGGVCETGTFAEPLELPSTLFPSRACPLQSKARGLHNGGGQAVVEG